MEKPVIESVNRLTATERKKALDNARSGIRGEIGTEPIEADFKQGVDANERNAKVVQYFILFCIMVIALLLSAVKQYLASVIIFSPVSNDSAVSWSAQFAPFLLLAFGETSAVFFMAIANSLPPHNIRIGRLAFNFSALACYFWAFICAMIAVVGNVTITINHWNEVKQAAVLAVIETLAPPLTALYIGWVGERLYAMTITEQKQAKAAYLVAKTAYKSLLDAVHGLQWINNIAEYPLWNKRLQDNLITLLIRDENNKALLSNDKNKMKIAVQIEIYDLLEVFDFEVNPINSQN